MREKPILFSGPMVRAILEGRQTQTRRVVKPAVPVGLEKHFPFPAMRGGALEWREKANQDFPMYKYFWRCPYGQPGDRLWVRESFQPLLADGVKPWGCNYKTGEGYEVFYPATDPVQEFDDLNDEGTLSSRVWPSIHMPRWASRITLEVTEVRVQRLQDISAEDAIAEGGAYDQGWETSPGDGDPGYGYLDYSKPADEDFAFTDPRDSFRTLWDSINGQRHGRDWASNPWVWAVSFKKVTTSASA